MERFAVTIEEKEQEIKVLVGEGGYLPIKVTAGDIGFDLKSPTTIVCEPGIPEEINTLVSVELPEGIGGLLFLRSSVGCRGLVALGQVVDTGFRGQLKVFLVNVTADPLKIRRGERFAQLVPIKVGNLSVTQADVRSSQNRFGESEALAILTTSKLLETVLRASAGLSLRLD